MNSPSICQFCNEPIDNGQHPRTESGAYDLTRCQAMFLLRRNDELQSKLARHLKLIEEIHDDLLQRAEVGRERELVVNLSHSLWCRLCDAAEDPQ